MNTKKKSKMAEMMEVERLISIELSKLKNDVCEEIKQNSPNGYKESSSLIYTVNLKDLEKTILSPSYYHPRKQAEFVRHKLDLAKTPSMFVNAMKEMVKTKQVVIGKNKEPLNSKTIMILADFMEKI